MKKDEFVLACLIEKVKIKLVFIENEEVVKVVLNRGELFYKTSIFEESKRAKFVL